MEKIEIKGINMKEIEKTKEKEESWVKFFVKKDKRSDLVRVEYDAKNKSLDIWDIKEGSGTSRGVKTKEDIIKILKEKNLEERIINSEEKNIENTKEEVEKYLNYLAYHKSETGGFRYSYGYITGDVEVSTLVAKCILKYPEYKNEIIEELGWVCHNLYKKKFSRESREREDEDYDTKIKKEIMLAAYKILEEGYTPKGTERSNVVDLAIDMIRKNGNGAEELFNSPTMTANNEFREAAAKCILKFKGNPIDAEEILQNISKIVNMHHIWGNGSCMTEARNTVVEAINIISKFEEEAKEVAKLLAEVGSNFNALRLMKEAIKRLEEYLQQKHKRE